MKQVQKVSLLNGFGETSTVYYKVLQYVSKFMQNFYYAGLKIGNVVDSRVRVLENEN